MWVELNHQPQPSIFLFKEVSLLVYKTGEAKPYLTEIRISMLSNGILEI